MYFKYSYNVLRFLDIYIKQILDNNKAWYSDQYELYDIIKNKKSDIKIFDISPYWYCEHKTNITDDIINNKNIYFIAPRKKIVMNNCYL